MKKILAVVTVVAMLLGNLAGLGIVYADEVKTVRYELAADTYVANVSGMADSALGVNDAYKYELYARNMGGGNQDRIIYMKLDCSDWAGYEVDNAVLNLFAPNWDPMNNMNQGTITVSRIDDKSWLESEVTYNNQPSDEGLQEVATIEITGVNKWYQVDLTEALNNEADKVLSLKITGDPERYLHPESGRTEQERVKFASREVRDETQRPYFEVTGAKPDTLVEGVKLDTKELTLTAKGESAQLTATVSPQNATNRDVIWSSSDETVATVSASGVVTPVAEGSATITVTTVDGNFTDTCIVYVNALGGEGTIEYKFPISDDTFVSSADPGIHGSETVLYTRGASGQERTIYLKANASAIAGYEIIYAGLHLKTSSVENPVDVTVRGFNDNAWTEGSVDYANRPAENGLTDPLSIVTVDTEAAWYEFDVTNYVAGKTDGVLSFKAQGSTATDSNDRTRFHSNNAASSDAPYVVILAKPYSIAENGSESVTLSTRVFNNEESAKNGVLMAATYDKDGVMQNLVSNTKEVAANNTTFFALDFKPVDISREYVKFFMWDSLETMKPYLTDYKYSKGCDEYDGGVPAVAGLQVDGHKFSVSGSVQPEETVTLVIGNETAAAYLNQTTADKEGKYYFNGAFGADIADGEYTAKVYAASKETITEFPFYLLNTEEGWKNAIANAQDSTDLQHIIEPNAAKFGLQDSRIFTVYFVEAGDTLKTAILQDALEALQNTAPASASDVKNVIVEKTALHLIEQGDRVKVQNMVETCYEDLSITSSTMREYKDSLSNTGKTNVIKEVYGKAYNSLNAFAAAFKEAVESELPAPTKAPGGGGGSGSGGGGGNRTPTLVQNNMPTATPVPTQPPVQEEFTDLSGYEWAKDSIKTLSDKAIVNGYGDGRFGPADDVTREQFIKMLVIALDIADTSATCSYVDVQAGEWYYTYVAAATKLGIVNGISDTEFGIGQRITRQDMAVMTYRAAQAVGKQLGTNGEAADFSDYDAIEAYAKEAVSAMQETGLITGMGDGSFQPAGFANRAQAAVIIGRLLAQ